MQLSLRDFGVAFGEQVVLANVTLETQPSGITVLVGPAGAGKSTLIRTLAGLNASQPSLRTWGKAELGGRPIDTEHKPRLVYQNARMLGVSLRENLVSALPSRANLTRAEQDRLLDELLRGCGLGHVSPHLNESVALLPMVDKRRIAIVRQLLREPELLLVDEPTAALEPEDAELILRLLRQQGANRGVLVVTHNQMHARALGGNTALLAGGVIQESAPTAAFFEPVGSSMKLQYLRTGRCSVPSPNAKPEELAPDAPEPVRAPVPSEAPSRGIGPRGFYWLARGRVGGCPRPGVVANLSYDLDALRRLGTTLLINLEEHVVYPEEDPVTRGMMLLHIPIVDMEAPELEVARELCETIDEHVKNSGVVVAHCRAGLGRTGLLMALYWIWCGHGSAEAFDHIRGINPKWIQSEVQIDFLPVFEQHLAHARGGGGACGHSSIPPAKETRQ